MRLTAKELAVLGHVLRAMPPNLCVMSQPDYMDGEIMVIDAPAFKSLWNKVAADISERKDMAPYRSGKAA